MLPSKYFQFINKICKHLNIFCSRNNLRTLYIYIYLYFLKSVAVIYLQNQEKPNLFLPAPEAGCTSVFIHGGLVQTKYSVFRENNSKDLLYGVDHLEIYPI